MIRYWIALLYCFFTTACFAHDEEAQEEFFPSSPEQIASLSSEPSYLIGGLISPLSGQPVLRAVDLVAKGAQTITLSRTYIPPYIPSSFEKHKHNQAEYDKSNLYHHLARHYKGWQFYPHTKLTCNPHNMAIVFTDPNGMSLEFRLSGPNYSVTTLSSSDGITNAAGDCPSGKYDPRNIRISYEDNGDRITVYSPDGISRFYFLEGSIRQGKRLYLLEKEVLASGKIFKYRYNKEKELDYIESLDPQEKFVYAFIQIEGSSRKGSCHFTSSSLGRADYKYESRPLHVKIKEKEKHWYGNDGYTLKHNYRCPPILTSVSSPFYREESLDYCSKFLIGSYFGKDDVFKTLHTVFGEGAGHYRVHQLMLPTGPNDSFGPVYELSYQPPIAGQKEGAARVKNTDGTSTLYSFSKSLLTTLIQYFGADGVLQKEKVFSWDDRNWLKSFAIRDAKNNNLYSKSFEYDRFGNPILEVFAGDLTGEGNHETFTTTRTFSQDGKNLLLTEQTEDGKVICFSYLPGTDLVTAKLIKEGSKIILREFFTYDDCNNLIQTISDDGIGGDKNDLSCVSQRVLTTYTLRQNPPFLHMPEWIEQTYFDGQIEQPLKKRHLIYDEHGNVAQEQIYDAAGNYTYTIYKTYNERGDILSESEPLGKEAHYTYDVRGRRESSLNFSHRMQTTLCYDTKGRLKRQIDKADDGTVHLSASEYDDYDRLIQQKDSFDNVTSYTYDPLVSQVIKTEFPKIPCIDGRASSVCTLATYDPFGRQLTKTDGSGNTTNYFYNAYGAETEIIHPHTGKETFRYAKNGQLICYTDLDGLKTYYNRDILGRVLSKTYIAEDGAVLAQETFTYNGFNILTYTDKEGNVKEYAYDGSGRKTKEVFCHQLTEFSYDSLGYLASTCKHNGNNTLVIHYKRDVAGKLLEEDKTDTSGTTLYRMSYGYDSDGNRETITKYINGKESVETLTYDPFQRIVSAKDPLGYITKTLYDESYTNGIGQKVLQTVTTDPTSISTIVTEDALHRTIKKEIIDQFGKMISCQEMIRNAQGNLLYQHDHVYKNGCFLNTQTIGYTYTPDHRLASFIRGVGTKDARTTTYTYLPSGKIKSKTLPDGVTLAYTYTPLGFMSRLDSSDGAIHHAFEYDLMGHLKLASDDNQNIVISRKTDPCGNVLEEVFPYGVEVKKDYDRCNRLISLRISGQGKVLYDYDPLFLRGVRRISSKGKLLYKHTYEKYDEAGHLVLENLIGNLGQITHVRGLKGQKQLIAIPYFNQQCEYDPVGNLISSRIDRVEHRYSYDGLCQLTSDSSSNQSFSYTYDSLYNRTEKDGLVYELSGLNELLSIGSVQCLYDVHGNQVVRQTPNETFEFTYDPLHRLIDARSAQQKISFSYDPLGRRIGKIVCLRDADRWKETLQEHYVYHGQSEIAAFASSDECTHLRVLGLSHSTDSPNTIGVEIQGRIMAPLIDIQGNIGRLIDLESQTITSKYDFTPFGQERLKYEPRLFNPWRFASKRFDPELGLVYFGKRYYDPALGRWLTTDPAGFVDSANLYQYVFNNPFRYRDPDGQFIVAIPLLALTWKVVAIAALTGYAAYELERQHEHSSSSFARSFNSAVHQIVQGAGGVSKYAGTSLAMGKKQIDARLPNSPDELSDDLNPSHLPEDPQNDKNEKKTPGNLQKQIEQGKAPKSVDRADKGRGPYEKDHLHFKDESALNSDGTWKHGERDLTREEINWLQKNGWTPSL